MKSQWESALQSRDNNPPPPLQSWLWGCSAQPYCLFSTPFQFSHALTASTLHLDDQSSKGKKKKSSKALSNHGVTLGSSPMAITHLTARQKENEGSNHSIHTGPLLSIIPAGGNLPSAPTLVAQPRAGRGRAESPGVDQHDQSLSDVWHCSRLAPAD